MTTDLTAEILTHLDQYPTDLPPVNALRHIVKIGHIPGPDGLCLDCRWSHPCITVMSIGYTLGLITEDDIAGDALRAQWDTAHPTRETR